MSFCHIFVDVHTDEEIIGKIEKAFTAPHYFIRDDNFKYNINPKVRDDLSHAYFWNYNKHNFSLAAHCFRKDTISAYRSHYCIPVKRNQWVINIHNKHGKGHDDFVTELLIKIIINVFGSKNIRCFIESLESPMSEIPIL
ncbi:MAG: hypothetical protein R3B60_04920 [Candidatus Paceibacterota bacterium]